ncbi:MAG: class I SAM-dependent methyltransferase [Methanobrevibacter sp.]|nr:class I SAM-dependent methyltransferase [Methanobrevibacter sp.]
MSQYFENDNQVISDPKSVTCWCGEHCLKLTTDHGVFSYGEIDDASQKLVKYCQSLKGDVLDLGCGYGFIGIYLKTKYPTINLYQSDVNERAVFLCKENCSTNNIQSTIIVSDGFSNIYSTFDYIVFNPPIHAGKTVCNSLIDTAFIHLNNGGVLFLVLRKKHGAEGYIKRFEDKEYDFSIIDKKDGIYIISITKPE